MLLLSAFMLVPAAAAIAIGHIALIVGEAKRTDAKGRTESLHTGVSVAEGDRIITGVDSIAMIIFIDEARLSLRADSELLIKQYKVDYKGADNHLNFQLLRGAMRQISGKSATMQPERYRLNTPIASIGVRGTDFLAKTSSNALETFIQEGKIVVLSNAQGCFESPTDTKCTPLAALAATDAARYLKVLSNGQIERRNVPADEVERTFGISVAKAVPTINTAKAASATVNVYTEITEKNNSTSTTPELLASLDLPSPTKSQSIELIKTTEVVAPVLEVLLPVKDPSSLKEPTSLKIQPDLTRQLVWGRYDSAETLPLAMMAPYSEAVKGRHVTVGELMQYGLYRNGTNVSFATKLKGDVHFDIHTSEAYFANSKENLPAEISNPKLSINFDRATFNSSLTVSQAQIGSTTIQATGRVNDEGILLSKTTNQLVAGAVSQNGKEAGLLFTKDYANGAFKGVTLWNVR